MSVTIIFENGTERDYPNAADVQARGQGLVVVSADGTQIAAHDGPIASVVINGEEIEWPPN